MTNLRQSIIDDAVDPDDIKNYSVTSVLTEDQKDSASYTLICFGHYTKDNQKVAFKISFQYDMTPDEYSRSVKDAENLRLFTKVRALQHEVCIYRSIYNTLTPRHDTENVVLFVGTQQVTLDIPAKFDRDTLRPTLSPIRDAMRYSDQDTYSDFLTKLINLYNKYRHQFAMPPNKCLILITEASEKVISLQTYLTTYSIPNMAECIKVLLLQILITLKKLRGYRHNDLHRNNILIEIGNHLPEYMFYENDNRVYRLAIQKYGKIRIFDWDCGSNIVCGRNEYLDRYMCKDNGACDDNDSGAYDLTTLASFIYNLIKERHPVKVSEPLYRMLSNCHINAETRIPDKHMYSIDDILRDPYFDDRRLVRSNIVPVLIDDRLDSVVSQAFSTVSALNLANEGVIIIIVGIMALKYYVPSVNGYNIDFRLHGGTPEQQKEMHQKLWRNLLKIACPDNCTLEVDPLRPSTIDLVEQIGTTISNRTPIFTIINSDMVMRHRLDMDYTRDIPDSVLKWRAGYYDFEEQDNLYYVYTYDGIAYPEFGYLIWDTIYALNFTIDVNTSLNHTAMALYQIIIDALSDPATYLSCNIDFTNYINTCSGVNPTGQGATITVADNLFEVEQGEYKDNDVTLTMLIDHYAHAHAPDNLKTHETNKTMLQAIDPGRGLSYPDIDTNGYEIIVKNILGPLVRSGISMFNATSKMFKCIISGGEAFNYYIHNDKTGIINTHDFDLRIVYNGPFERLYDDPLLDYKLSSSMKDVCDMIAMQITRPYIDDLNRRLAVYGIKIDKVASFEWGRAAGMRSVSNYYSGVTVEFNNHNMILVDCVFMSPRHEPSEGIGEPIDFSRQARIPNGKYAGQPYWSPFVLVHQPSRFSYMKKTLSNQTMYTHAKSDSNLYYVSMGYLLWDTIRMLNVSLDTQIVTRMEKERLPFRSVEPQTKFRRYIAKYKILIDALCNPSTYLTCNNLPFMNYYKKCQAGHVVASPLSQSH